MAKGTWGTQKDAITTIFQRKNKGMHNSTSYKFAQSSCVKENNVKHAPKICPNVCQPTCRFKFNLIPCCFFLLLFSNFFIGLGLFLLFYFHLLEFICFFSFSCLGYLY
jgi:hypothetical protein